MRPCDIRSAIATSLFHVKVTGHKSPVPFTESPHTPDLRHQSSIHSRYHTISAFSYDLIHSIML